MPPGLEASKQSRPPSARATWGFTAAMAPDAAALARDSSPRPRGAPGVPHVAPAVWGASREPGASAVEFSPKVAPAARELKPTGRLY